MAKLLGKLRQINPREFFGEETEAFSMWLAQDEILQMLGETIGFDIERNNGNTQVDVLKDAVLAKQASNNEHVIIIGQLQDTIYSDLGKLITYAAGLDATAVIWIGSKIPQEHRKALEWLNQVTQESLNFYGTEMELWQIDDSAPAPKFSLVCEPNSRPKSIKFGQEVQEPELAVEKVKDKEKEEQEVREKGKEKEKEKAKPTVVSNGEKLEPEVLPPATPKPKIPLSKAPKPQPQQSSSDEGVSVRQNFVYTTKNWPGN